MPRYAPTALLCLLLLGAAPAADPPSIATPFRFSSEGAEREQGVRLLGTLQLSDPGRTGPTLTGLSGLAWDARSDRLYALGDRGALFHLQPRFEAGRLVDVRLLAAYRLRGTDGEPLPASRSDSEGLALAASGELLISFEGRPRVDRYRPDGTYLGTLALSRRLANARLYHDTNSMLEALAIHPTLGPIVGVERPFKGEKGRRVPLCALAGPCWDYPLADAPASALTDLEVLPDGDLLTLERAYVSLFRPLIISLRRVHLPAASGAPLEVETVATFDSSRGWSLDNFEGLAHHTGNRYFMVSDDNSSPLQHTLLVYFELLP